MTRHAVTLSLPDGRTSFEPGSSVDVTVSWALNVAPYALQLRLYWETRGKGNRAARVVQTERIDPTQPTGFAVCRVVLPLAPWSFSGRLVSLVWMLEAVVTATDARASCELVVAPDESELLLFEPVRARILR